MNDMPYYFDLVSVKAKASLVYTPEWWNAPERIEKANCYAYALDEPALGWPWLGDRTRVTHAFANAHDRLQRDSIARLMPKPKTMEEKAKAMRQKIDILLHHDGLERIHKHAVDPNKNHIMAYSDFLKHWWRQERGGFWAGKPMQYEVRNVDVNGHVLYDLEAPGIVLCDWAQPYQKVDIAYYRVRPNEVFTWRSKPGPVYQY